MRFATFGPVGQVCRLGLAAHMNGSLTERDVLLALDQGINFLNWPGTPDYLSRAIAALGPRRRDMIVCVQFEARSASAAERELDTMLRELHSDHVDVITFYYVEAQQEWDEIAAPGGALEYCRRARDAGKIRMLGLTSHQRALAAAIAGTGLIDMLMIRYNAAHRGAETDIFPVTEALRMPVVTYTSTRWGALTRPTPDDPPDFVVPGARDWYRFVLQNPCVTVALMAPLTRVELEEDLQALSEPISIEPKVYQALTQHGQRVRRHAGQFP